ncbi:hypothetical protein K502DRAFT_323327 [Neoconidiobolus thromboides FSU 785]|nr:hypothetical protein K502DRAFT_323327 [Neoconidiobolus thromboides FSU 785]
MSKVEQYSNIESAIRNSDIKTALSLVEDVLKSNPTDLNGLYCKLLLLIREEKFHLALKLLEILEKEKGSNKFDLEYPKGYCLYRVNKAEEAEKLIKSSKLIETREYKKLLAQITLKTEDFETCLRLYNELLQNTLQNHPDYIELLTNYQAAYASACQKSYYIKGEELAIGKTKTYELIYNTAIISMAKGDYQSTQSLLNEAEKLCRITLKSSDYSEQEINQELAPILIQLAYLKHIQGDVEKSLEIYQNVLKQNSVDEPTKVVINNNLIVMNQEKLSLLEQVYKLNQTLSGTSFHRLTKLQKISILKNQIALYLQLHMFPNASNIARKIQKLDHQSNVQIIVTASNFIIQGDNTKAINEIKNYTRNNGQDIQASLALTHLYVKEKQYELAIDTLETLHSKLENPNEKYLPGLIGTLLWLYQLTNNDNKAETLLHQAHQANSPYSSQYESIVQRKMAENKFKSRQANEAAMDYQLLLDHNPNDIDALSGLIKALSLIDPDKADQYLNQLPKPKILEDISALEARFSDIKFGQKLTTLEPRVSISKKRKNHRHNKPPKNINSGIKIDLQRWLPMKDRSYYRNKNKKNKQIRGSQGIAAITKEVAAPVSKVEEPAKVKPKKVKKKVKIIRH